jgi:acyl-CoA synthetase (AMP-forming)/AMP-acid ligase II
MWPFLTGRPFADTQIRIPSEVSAAIETHQQIVLISSPAFLARARQILDFEQLSASALIAFSSGGPLDGDTAMHFNATPDVSLVEIYGSTETGALAHRSRVDDPLTPWQPLPGVEIDIVEGFLTVHARHAHCNRRVKTADRAEAVPGGGFILKGRADQIVKVADKRVSLSELERLLHARPEVAEARVLQLEDGRLGGVVSPTDSGWEQVRRLGKSRFVSALRDHLSQHVDRVTTPRRWRLTKTIPRNTQGKVELAALRTLFAHDADRKLEWHTLKSDANTWIASTTVPADLPELDGHFPGEPVVPGVAQLSWAATAAKRQFGLQHLSGAMENVKFRKPILPGCTVRLTLRLATNARRVDFELSDDNQVYSSGRFLLEGCEFRPA